VPLFVLISAYLLVPISEPVGAFFKKRFSRVIIPFAIWSILYATLPFLWKGMCIAEVNSALLHLTYNFNDASGHMWFIYMLIGLYLFMPIISPWLQKADKKSEQLFLLLWFTSTLFPYLRNFVGDIYGECYWNEFNTLWYFSGFIGYIVLAHYIRYYLKWSYKKRLIIGILSYCIGYAITGIIWYNRISTASTLQELELSWRFCTPNVVLESLGAFLIIEAIFHKAKNNPTVTKLSNISYGMYLMHIFILGGVYSIFEDHFSTPVTILLVGGCTFVLCALLAKILSLLPKSKYIIG
jgi:surface polysaccharide O-acyltransferase-like enzyme